MTIEYHLATLRLSRLWTLVIFPTFYQIATHSTEILPKSKQLVRLIIVPNCPTFTISQGLSMDQFWTNSCGMKVSNIKIFEYFSLFKTSQGYVSWRSESSNVSLVENQNLAKPYLLGAQIDMCTSLKHSFHTMTSIDLYIFGFASFASSSLCVTLVWLALHNLPYFVF